MSPSPPTWAVIVAGGVGSRFWPASRRERPKQLLPLGTDDRPLVVEAVERAREIVGGERIRIVAGEHLQRHLRELLPGLDDEHFMVEPRARGTGPALVWAAHAIERLEPDAVMVSLHADHRISPPTAFRETIDRAIRAADESDRLFCIGIRPDRPETGYGYVHLGEPLSEKVHEVERFVEKPDAETARRYLEGGEHLWNTGLFVWRAGRLLEAVREHTPEIRRALDRLEAGDAPGFFADVEPISIDVGVMERDPRVGVVEATFRWDDMGVWTALGRTFPADADGNVSIGSVRIVEGEENIAWAEEGRVTIFGTGGLVVVRSGEDVLVTTRERAPDLKRLLHLLDEREEDEG